MKRRECLNIIGAAATVLAVPTAWSRSAPMDRIDFCIKCVVNEPRAVLAESPDELWQLTAWFHDPIEARLGAIHALRWDDGFTFLHSSLRQVMLAKAPEAPPLFGMTDGQLRNWEHIGEQWYRRYDGEDHKHYSMITLGYPITWTRS